MWERRATTKHLSFNKSNGMNIWSTYLKRKIRKKLQEAFFIALN